MKMSIKNPLRYYFIFASMFLFPFHSLKSQSFNQTEFMIGTYGEKQMDLGGEEIFQYLNNNLNGTALNSFNTRKTDYINYLTGIKDAHFNLMSGLLFRHGTNSAAGFDNRELLYSMELLSTTPSLSGLKRMVYTTGLFGNRSSATCPTCSFVVCNPSPNCTTYYYGPDVYDKVFVPSGLSYNNFCPSGNCNDVLYGFHTSDEPPSVDKDNLLEWGEYINLKSPGKTAFINFSGGAYWGNVSTSTGRTGYLNHLNDFLTPTATGYSPDVVGFTYYPFIETECESGMPDHAFNNSNLGNYFWALSKTRSIAGNKPLWAVPMSVYHKQIDIPITVPFVSGLTTCASSVTITHTDPTYNHLMFTDFCPLAYGAKGLFYFTYDRENNPKFLNAIVDPDPSIGSCTQRYEDVKNINHYIKNIVGPVIMNSQWNGAVHKSNLPTNEVELTSTGELSGDLLNSNHFLISDIDNDNILIGVFTQAQTCDYYLLVVNKDLNYTPSPFEIKLKGFYGSSISIAPSVGYAPQVISTNPCTPYSPPGWSYDGSTLYTQLATSYSISTNITTFTMPTLYGGEGRMVKIQYCYPEGPNDPPVIPAGAMISDFALKVSPNPASNIMTIDFNITNSDIHQKVTLKFVNSYGKLMDEIEVNTNSENNSILYTLPSKFEAGLYHLILTVDGMNVKHKSVQIVR